MSSKMKRKKRNAGKKSRSAGKAGSARKPGKTGRKDATIKGGDGSRYVKPKRGKYWKANSRVCLTGKAIAKGTPRVAFLNSLVPTTDEGDRAHSMRRLIVPGLPTQFDGSWMLVPMCELVGRGQRLPGRLRRYHPSQVTSRGLGFDSMYDRLARSAAELQAAGIELGMHTRFEYYSTIELERAVSLAGLGPIEARKIIEQQCTQSMTPDERRLENEGTKILASMGGDGAGGGHE